MKKIKLALIGKGISHSKSSEIYSKILGNSNLEYTHLDILNQKDLPAIVALKNKFNGISITAPYKKVYLDKIDKIDPACPSVKCINHLRFDSGVIGASTDYLAIKYLLLNDYGKYLQRPIIILGNGSMAELVAQVLTEMGLSCLQLSRHLNGDLNNQKLYEQIENPFIINTCSRDFKLDEVAFKTMTIWDLNYSTNYNFNSYITYLDGFKMLQLQAYYSLELWGLADFATLVKTL